MNGRVNKVILVGNLGKNPEIRKLESGALMARFSMATSEYYTDKTSGKKIESTDWHDVVVWRNLAETTEKYLKKGHKVYVEGKLRTRKWQGEDGVDKYTTEVNVDEFTFLSTKKDAVSNTEAKPVSENNNQKSDNTEDDLPF